MSCPFQGDGRGVGTEGVDPVYPVKKIHAQKLVRIQYIARLRLQHVPDRPVLLDLTSCLVEFSRDARIRALCAKAVATTDASQVDAVLGELRAELHTHIEELRTQTRKDVPFLIRTTKPQTRPRRESLRSKDILTG
jgi:hypothetical protein